MVETKSKSFKKPEPLFGIDPGKAVIAGAAALPKAAIRTGLDIYEGVTDRESREKVENVFSEIGSTIDKGLQSNLGPVGRSLSTTAKETIIQPELTPAEELISYFTGFGLTQRALQAGSRKVLGEPESKLGKATELGGTGVVADILVRPEDEVILPDLVSQIGDLAESYEYARPKEIEQLVSKLAIDPDDTVAERRLKQVIDSLAAVGAFGGTLFAAGKGAGFIAPKVAKGMSITANATAGKAKAVRDGILELPDNTPGKTVLTTVLNNIAPTSYQQAGTVYQALAKFNTGAGRLFTSTAAMPKQFFDAYLESRGFPLEMEIRIKGELKELKKLIDKSPDPEKARVAINQILNQEAGLFTTLSKGGLETQGVSSELIEKATKLRGLVDENSTKIIDSLGLPKDSKLRAAIDENMGGYLTRQFAFATNPKWSKTINRALKGLTPEQVPFIARIPGTFSKTKKRIKEHNADVLEVVANARKHLKELNPTYTDVEIDVLINSLVDSANKNKDSLSGLIPFLTGSDTGVAQKVLRGRKDLDKPILELLGEIKDPIDNLRKTLNSQNRLIAKAKYLRDIKNIVEENLDGEVALKGLFPFLPSKTAKFIKGGDVPQDVTAPLESLVEKELGRFGGDGSFVGLNNYYSTEDLVDILEKGIDIFDHSRAGPLLTALQRASAYVQGTETVLDTTAHQVNIMGMLHMLAGNGHLYNPKAYKEAVGGIKSVFERARAGDEEALKYMGRLKREGVIDSNPTAEAIKRNLDRFSGEEAEGNFTRIIRSPFRGLSYVYGATDDIGKIIGHRLEMDRYRNVFKDASEDELFAYASNIVRNTMPSYTTAPAIVRGLSRTPIGTYAVFPAEIIRTTYNMVKIALKDIRNSFTIKDPEEAAALFNAGFVRLASLGGTAAGIDYAIDSNNQALDVGENEIRAVNQVVPPFQRTTEKFFTKPLYRDTDGLIYTQFTDTGFIDARQSVKGPIKQIIGRVMAGQDYTDRELDQAFGNIFREVLGPYYSQKALTKFGVETISGVDEFGRPITTGGLDKPTDAATIAKRMFRVFLPAGVFGKGSLKLIDAYKAEEVAGRDFDEEPLTIEEIVLGGREGEGQTTSGFPNRLDEAIGHLKTGLRNNTMNYTRALGYGLYQDYKKLKTLQRQFNLRLKEQGQRKFTDEDIEDIVNTYERSTRLEADVYKNMEDYLSIARNAKYYDVKKKRWQTVTDMDIIRAATRNFENINEKNVDEIMRIGRTGYLPELMTDEGQDRLARKLDNDKRFTKEQKRTLTSNIIRINNEIFKATK